MMDANDLLLTRDAYLIPKAQPRLLSCDDSAGQRVREARGSWLLVALTWGVKASHQAPQKGWGKPSLQPWSCNAMGLHRGAPRRCGLPCRGHCLTSVASCLGHGCVT